MVSFDLGGNPAGVKRRDVYVLDIVACSVDDRPEQHTIGDLPVEVLRLVERQPSDLRP